MRKDEEGHAELGESNIRANGEKGSLNEAI